MRLTRPAVAVHAVEAPWLQHYRWPVALTVGYAAVLWLVDRFWLPGLWRPVIGGPPGALYVWWWLARILVAIVLVNGAWSLARRATGHPPAAFTAGRVGHAAFTSLVLVPGFFHLFRCWKTGIVRVQPFAYDPAFADLDAMLHGGDPWRWLHGFASSPDLIRWVDRFYLAYLVMLIGVVAWVAWRQPDALRARFLTAFMLCWVVLGTVVAILGSSAGPIFYDRLLGTDRYAELVALLEAARPIRTLTIAGNLWTSYLTNADQLVSGISAFPSMHVAMPTLYALTARHAGHRWLAGGFAVLAVCTLLASVYLGWHYAIDGYAAILGAFAMWWLAGRLTR